MDAFRHIPVSPFDSPLLGFSTTWKDSHYVERRSPFGLRSSPKLFNLFAEAFHWILENQFKWSLLHYLDDFLLALPSSMPPPAVRQAETNFDSTAARLGLSIKTAKSQTGTRIDFAGFELDSHDMRIRLGPAKRQKAQEMVDCLVARTSDSTPQGPAFRVQSLTLNC